MQMKKRSFRIGDLAQKLNVDKFVIRFWEKEFALSADRSTGGQRFYEEKDFETFQQIKTLLYEKKFTIAGAKEQLKSNNINNKNNIIASQKTNIPGISGDNSSLGFISNTNKQSKLDKKILKQIINLRKDLIKLKELL